MRTIRLHDTRSGAVADLEPREPGRVGIYACGPTVYNRIHVGNARPFVVFSLLKRYLEHEGYAVTFVANVTDVNDKIYDAARPLGVASADLAREMTAAYVQDTDRLELGRPDAEPLASETIEGIVALIAALLAAGSAYAVDGDVYFRVRSDPRYGELSHRRIDDMDQGEGVEGADRKEDPLDFALWKAQKPEEDTAWDAPWGRGRPGWHIECSAMAEQLLGVGFEIHGGGSDLIFPHHENEAAQTRAARGAELTRIWMHNGMLQLGGEKMAKSVGNIESLHDAVERWGRDALILLFVSGHYRQPIQYSEETLTAARTGAGGCARPPACSSRAPRPRTWARCASGSSPRSPTTSARRRRWPPSGTGSGSPTGAAAWGATTCARCSPSSPSTTCSRRPPPTAGPTRRPRAARAPRAGARRPRLRRGRPAPRRAARARLAGARLAGGPELVRAER